MAADLTVVAGLLKTRFEGVVQDMFQELDGDFKKLEARKKDTRGGNVKFPVRVARNWRGYGAAADGSTIPTAGNQDWKQFEVDPKIFYHTIKVSGPAIAKTKGGPSVGTYLEAILSETKYGLMDFRKIMNWQVHGSEEGYIAKISAASDAADTVTVDLSSTAQAIGPGQFGTDRLFGGEGMYVDIIDSDGDTVHLAGQLVGSVNRSTGVVALPSGANPETANVADGDFIALHAPGVTTSSTWGEPEMEGLLSAIDDGTVRTSYHGLSRSTYPVLKANTVDAGTSSAYADLSEDVMQQLLNAVVKNGGVTREELKSKYEWCMSLGMEAEYLALQLPGRRYSGPAFDGGVEEEMTYGGVPIRPSVDARAGQIYLLNWDNAELYEQQPIKWVDEDGNMLHRVHGTDQFEAVIRYLAETVWYNQHKMGTIRYLNETQVDYRF